MGLAYSRSLVRGGVAIGKLKSMKELFVGRHFDLKVTVL